MTTFICEHCEQLLPWADKKVAQTKTEFNEWIELGCWNFQPLVERLEQIRSKIFANHFHSGYLVENINNHKGELRNHNLYTKVNLAIKDIQVESDSLY